MNDVIEQLKNGFCKTKDRNNYTPLSTRSKSKCQHGSVSSCRIRVQWDELRKRIQRRESPKRRKPPTYRKRRWFPSSSRPPRDSSLANPPENFLISFFFIFCSSFSSPAAVTLFWRPSPVSDWWGSPVYPKPNYTISPSKWKAWLINYPRDRYWSVPIEKPLETLSGV